MSNSVLPGGSSNPAVAVPLTGTVTTNARVYSSYNGMYYCWIKPANYDPTKRYPLMLYMHQNDNGQPIYTANGDNSNDFYVGPYVQTWFNNTNFQANFNCFVLAPLLDQSADLSGAHVNFGGYDGTLQPSTTNCINLIKQFVSTWPIDTGRIYVTGASMGASGTIVDMLLFNTINGTNGGVFAAGLALSGVDYDAGGSSPNASVVAQMRAGVPLGLIHGAGDTDQPADRFSLPLWQDLGGTGTPSTWTRAGSTNCYLVVDPNDGHDTWDDYYGWPKFQTYANWLFSFTASGTQAASPNGTVVTAGSGGSIVDASGNVWTIASNTQVALNGATNVGTFGVIELAYVSGKVWQENGQGLWWYWSGSAWLPTNGTSTSPIVTAPAAPTLTVGSIGTSSVALNWSPVAAGSASPDQTVVIGPTGGSITDANGKVWTITAGSQVAINGVADASTANVAELAYVNSQVWRQNSAGTWWYASTGSAGSWLPPAGTTSPLTQPAVTYQPTYRIHGAATWTNFGSPTTATSTIVTGLASATAYDFEVIATSAAGSTSSNVAMSTTTAQGSTTPPTPPPPPTAVLPSIPTGLAVSNITANSLTFSWGASTGTAPISYQPQYRVHVTTSPPVTPPPPPVTPPPPPPVTPPPPPPVTPPPPPTVVPGAPSGLTVTSISTSTAALAWSAPTTGGTPTSYIVQAATVTNGSSAPPASANGTVVTNNAYSIIDSLGNVWAIDSAAKVTCNGSEIATGGVIGLAYISGSVWQVNTSVQWYWFSVSNGVGSNSGGPNATPGYTSPTNTTVASVGAGLIDSAGHIWGMTSGGQVIKDGVADTTTGNVIMVAYVGTTVWHKNSSGNWYSQTGTGWTGGSSTSPLTAAAVPAPLPSNGTAGTNKTRTWYQQPGTNFSFWNMPLGKNCNWGSASDADTQDLRRGDYPAINHPDNYGSPMYIGSSSDPTATFSVGNIGDQSNVMYDGSVISSEQWIVHIPLGATAAGPFPLGTDQAFNGCDLTKPGWYYFTGPVQIQNYQGGQTYHIADGGPYDTTLQPNGTHFYREPVTVDVFHMQQELFPNQGPAYNQHAGMIRAYDIDPAQNPARIPGTNIPAIQHVLRYSHWNECLKSNSYGAQGGNGDGTTTPLKPNSWPLNFQDWQGLDASRNSNYYTGNLLAGTHIGIPQGIAIPSGLSDAGKQIFYALQQFGGSFHDQGWGGVHFSADQDVCNNQTWINNANGDMKTIAQYLCPLRNQHKGGDDFANFPVNGPGPRVDPGPPPQALIPGFPTPSPNYTTVTGTSGSITDSFGTIWTITSAGKVAYQITRKISDWSVIQGSTPTVDNGTSNVVELAYVWGVIWHKNTNGDWYGKTSSFTPQPWAWMTNSGSLKTDPITAAKANAYPGTNGPAEITTTTVGPWVNVGTSSLTNDVVTGLTPGTKYMFQVIATDSAGQSTASPTVTASTLTS